MKILRFVVRLALKPVLWPAKLAWQLLKRQRNDDDVDSIDTDWTEQDNVGREAEATNTTEVGAETVDTAGEGVTNEERLVDPSGAATTSPSAEAGPSERQEQVAGSSPPAGEGTSDVPMTATGDRDVVLAVFCLVLSSFQLIEVFLPGVTRELYSTFEQAWILWIRPISDLGIWLGLWSWGFTPSVLFYAVILMGLGVAASRGLSERVLTAAVAFFSINLLIFWIMAIFWVEYGGIFEFLPGSTLYSLLMLTGIGLFITRSPSNMSPDSVSRPSTVYSSSGGPASAGTRTGAKSTRGADATGTGRAADTSASGPESQNSREFPPESGETTQVTRSSDDETDIRERESTKTKGTSPATSDDETKAAPNIKSSEGSSGGTPAPNDGDEKSEIPLETILYDLKEEAVTPDKIIELGDIQSGGELPDDVATVLERHADADDPDVRLAVCKVCAEIGDERASDILRRLRIDTDDRVSNAAVSGLN